MSDDPLVDKVRRVLIRMRSCSWETINPVLLKGSLGLDKTNLVIKRGDGKTAWNDLPPANFKEEE